MFPDYHPPEALFDVFVEADIVAADIDPLTRSVSVALYSEKYIPFRLLEQAQRGIASVYGLDRVALTATYPQDQLTQIEPEEVRHLFIARDSMSQGSLAGARWEWEGQTLHIHLRANGKDALQEAAPAVAKQLQEQFATPVSISIHSGEVLEGQALYDAMEQMRESVLSTLPTTVVEDKKEKPVEITSIFGKPFKGKSVPMQELNLDMGSVVIEGRVFNVEHKELKKRNAWVINFDMTDNTSSIRVSRFLENKDAKPILENIEVGSVVQVQGKLQVDNYTNETVLKPFAIMPGSMPKRQDKAEGQKRVELHLHTVMSNMDALTDTKAAIKQAAAWGHKAIAITDHGCCQSFTDALHTIEDWKGGPKVAGTDEVIKILYGCEGYLVENEDTKYPWHVILFAKNQTGLRNLYHLISDSNLKYFKRSRNRIPKEELIKLREGLIIGSACEAGELFQAILRGDDWETLKEIASFYDYLEIQPLANNRFMLEKGLAKDEEQLREYNRIVVRLGEELGKMVVATGDVHFLNPEDEIFRHILLATKGFDDADKPNPLYFRTTDEMLAEFAYLGEEKAYEIVVTNPNLIADMCDYVRPVPHNLFAPKIENSVEDLKSLVYGKMHRLYGENPPELIRKRIDTELNDIITCHYDVIYMSAQKLVQNSLENGYLVGSRGSVGSSIVAFMSGITEVNSFPPHYRCPNPECKYTTFDVPKGYECGADLPDAVCPKCGTPYAKEGFNIPFETFLGFGGDKVPDIDLNFSGEYQARAHAYCTEMFGKSHVFRAGTIGTVADKTAFGYVKKYLEERGKTASNAEKTRLATGCVGVRRSSGQHPGGLVVIPQENEIWDFCPVQHPADDPNSDQITTHFEYHSMEENLLKLDMLGHDDPTMIRMMEDLTGVDATTIPLDDKQTMSIFTSSKVLGYEDDEILGPTGAVAVPEFNTRFTRGVLLDTKPEKFDFLVRISGYTHGTDVWLGNAKDLIVSGTARVDQTIGCRDDIMIYLISCGLPEKRAFKIMESVRKGKGLPDGAEEEMVAAGVPDWYIGSCKKIKYLFPKAHAVAYVMMAFRIAWFKVNHPLAFYSAYFYRRSQKGGFDATMMTGGMEQVVANIRAIEANEDATAKDEDLLTTLEVVYEYYLRGFEFAPISLYESHATKFVVKDGKLIPPFVAVSGLGETAAWDLMNGREGKTFLSIDEVAAACPKVSKTHLQMLKEAGAFGDLPDTAQVNLFDTF